MNHREQMRRRLRKQDRIAMILGSAPSQEEFLAALAVQEDLDWQRITTFQMDEYIGLTGDAPRILDASCGNDYSAACGLGLFTTLARKKIPLTTIAQPKYRMGRLPMQILYELIQGRASLGDGYNLVESPLVVRESTAPAPSANGRGST